MGFKKMRPRKKVCFFTKNHIKFVDYKDIELLTRFVSPDGKITPRSITGTSAKYQRELAKAVKNARFMALLPEPGQN
jgi:small subunit ribosomal protein S18